MAYHTYKTQGVILKRFNYGEADKILTILSLHYGKIHCLAKGIRKLTSRKSGCLELFNLVTIFVVKGKNLDLITEVSIVNPFLNWRKNLNKVALAFQFCELCDRLTADNQENKLVFDLLTQSLENLGNKKINVDRLTIDFKKQVLKLTGFGLPAICNNNKNLDVFIEKIIEKKINSNLLLKSLGSSK